MAEIKVGDWVKRRPLHRDNEWASECTASGQPVDKTFLVSKVVQSGIALNALSPAVFWEPYLFAVEKLAVETSMKIFKYTLPIQEETSVEMHVGAKIIRIDGLDGGLWIWAIVDENAATEKRHFKLFKTGASMPKDILSYTYLGCGAIHIQQELMLYVFEKQQGIR